MTIEETRNWKVILDIVRHPEIRAGVFGDNWEKLSHNLHNIIKDMVENPENHSLLVIDNDKAVGCWVLKHQDGGVMEVHTLLLPECRGKLALEAGKMAMRFVSKLNDVTGLVSYCPICHPEVYWFARMLGWKKGGIAPTKFLKDGVEYFMRIVSISKGELCR